LSEFRESGEVYPKLTTASNIATCLRELGRLEEALEWLESIPARFELSHEERFDLEAAIASISLRLGRLQVLGALSEVGLDIDGRRATVPPMRGSIRLRPGTHRVRVEHSGRAPVEVDVVIAAGETTTIDLQAPDAQRFASRAWSIDLEVGGLWAASLGGEIAGCEDGCGVTAAFGWRLGGHVTYRLDPSWQLSADAGYLEATQYADSRPAIVQYVGGNDPGHARDRLSMLVGSFGFSISYVPPGVWAPIVRMGAGSLVGTLRDERDGEFTHSSVAESGVSHVIYDVHVSESRTAIYGYLSLAVQANIRVTQSIFVGVGVEAMAMFAIVQPRWESRVLCGADSVCPPGGVSWFGNGSLSGRALFIAEPFVRVGYSF
jgi:hypothetical protein